MAEQPAAPPPADNAPQGDRLVGDRRPSLAEEGNRLSLDEAVQTLNEFDRSTRDEREERERDERGRFKPRSADQIIDDKEAASAAEASEEEGDEPSELPDEEADPSDSEAVDETEDGKEPEEQFVDGAAKTRLRDGTTVAVADLKKAYDELQEVRRGGVPAEIRQEIDKVASDLQQRQQYLDKTLPLAIEALKGALPPEPEPDLWDSDPIQATIDQRKHDLAKQKLQSLMQAGQQQTEAQRQEQQVQFTSFIKEQQAKLHEARPELKDPAKATAFYEKYKVVGKQMGFADEELDQTYDSRLILGVMSLAEKAEKWDKLQASKPQAEEKMKRAVPMAKPGRRVEPEARRSAEVESFRRRFSESPSIDTAAALIGKLGL